MYKFEYAYGDKMAVINSYNLEIILEIYNHTKLLLFE